MSKQRRSRKRRRNRKQNSGLLIPKKFIPHILIGVGVLAVGLAVFSLVRGRNAPAGYEPEYTGGPRIEVAQEVYDYGYVKLDTVITTDVEITNVGDKPLKITSVPQVQVLEGC